MFNPQAWQTATGANPVKSPSAPSQVPVDVQAAAAAAPVRDSCGSYQDMYTLIDNSSMQPATDDAKRRLVAVPAGLSQGPSGKGSHFMRGKGRRLASEGQIVSKLFNAVASRPQPTNALRLEQGITISLEYANQGWLTSTTTAGTGAFNSLTVVLGQFSAAGALAAVFDQYRIEQVETWLEPQAPNGTAAVPTLYTAVDLDDANTPSSVSNIQDHLGAIVSGGLAGHYHKWRPHTATAVYSGAFTSFANTPAQWIDCASPGVQHYGYKAGVVSTGGSYAYTLTVRAVVSFRAPSIN